jgi:hypothetical protein
VGACGRPRVVAAARCTPLAVRLYNDPAEVRSFEGFVVHMHLAWKWVGDRSPTDCRDASIITGALTGNGRTFRGDESGGAARIRLEPTSARSLLR